MYLTRKLTVFITIICVFVSSLGGNVIASEMVDTQEETNVLIDDLNDPKDLTDEIETEDLTDEIKTEDPTDEIEEDELEELLEQEEITIEENSESSIVEEESQSLKEENELLNFVVPLYLSVETPGKQEVIISIGTEETQLSNAVLHYTNKTTMESFQTEATKYLNDTILFEMEYKDASLSGLYELDYITYTREEQEAVVYFNKLSEPMQYSVNQQIEVTPDAYVVNKEPMEMVEENVVVFDENGNTLSTNSLDETLQNASNAQKSSLTRASSNVVIVLDPGHDSYHTGASYYGLKEHELSLAIAKYCKQELETYSNVKVILTRSTASCANGGGELSKCLDKRVETARKANATALVSLHLNASTSSSANGVGVYCPNSNWKANIGKRGQDLGRAIASRLRGLGINGWSGAPNGVAIWNSSSETYDDGSIADYLGIVQRSKRAGFPGIIVEHAFLSNASDVANFLNSATKLKNLGVADAKGIADYFGLRKGNSMEPGKPVMKSTKSLAGGKIDVRWGKIDNVISYHLYRSTKKDSGYENIADVGNKLSYTDTKVKVGQLYYYKVIAVLKNNTASHMSEPMYGRALAKSQINYIRSVCGVKMDIQWKKVTAAKNYVVYRSTSKDRTFKKVYETRSATKFLWEDRDVKEGITYNYKVVAMETLNGVIGKGSFSNVKSNNITQKTKIEYAKSTSDKTLELKWNEIKEAQFYYIYRSEKNNGVYKVIAKINAQKDPIYVDKNIIAEKEYFYKIRVVRIDNGMYNSSAFSNCMSAKTIKKPTINTLKVSSVRKVNVSWNKINGATGYYIQRSLAKENKYKTVSVIKKASITDFSDKNVKSGQSYKYRIQAITDKKSILGKSGYCTAKTIVVK